MKNKIIAASVLLFTAISWITADSISITIDTSAPGHQISPYLVGLHQVYTFTPDHVFADGQFAAWVKRTGVSTSRFPGGSVVKHWDWENPTGQPFINSLDPEFDPGLNPPEDEWMSLDEFLEFAKRAGLYPFFGVNSATGSLYDREAEGIEKAVRMVTYVKENGFPGGLWYIGNEEGHYHGGTIGYAQVFRRYAEAMKAVDPDIRIFWNANNPTEKNVREFLQNDGGTADGLETHGKWPYGGSPDLSPGTFDEWIEEMPLRDGKNGDKQSGGRRWRYAADSYRAWAAEHGRKLLIANNEYGLGKGSNVVGFSRYTTGLLMTELLMEHFIGNWFATSFWDLTRGTENGLLDPQNDYRRNPFSMGMNMLADCQGGTFLQTITTSHTGVHGFASKKDDILILYVLNKTPESQTLLIEQVMNGYSSASARQMQDSPDGYGVLEAVTVNKETDKFSIELPSLTFSEILIRPEDWHPDVQEVVPVSAGLTIRWNSLPGLPFDLLQSSDLDSWEISERADHPDNLWTATSVGTGNTNRFYKIDISNN